jgi:hypothetical protein
MPCLQSANDPSPLRRHKEAWAGGAVGAAWASAQPRQLHADHACYARKCHAMCAQLGGGRVTLLLALFLKAALATLKLASKMS